MSSGVVGVGRTSDGWRNLMEGEVIAKMYASFENVALSAKKDGYLVKFFVDLNDADEIVKLNEAIQRIVVLTVARRPRRSEAIPVDWMDSFTMLPEAWQGS